MVQNISAACAATNITAKLPTAITTVIFLQVMRLAIYIQMVLGQ